MTTCSDGDPFFADAAIDYSDYTEMDGCYEILGDYYFLDGDGSDGQPFFLPVDAVSALSDPFDNVSEELTIPIPSFMCIICVVYFTGVRVDRHRSPSIGLFVP